MTDWPNTIPIRILREGYSFQAVAADPVRTEMEGGPARQRGRPLVPQRLTCALRLYSADEHAALVTFLRTTLGNGAGQFDAAFWIPGDSSPPPVRTWQLVPPINAASLSGLVYSFPIVADLIA